METRIKHFSLVISAVNLTEGGPLTLLRECLKAAVKVLPIDWKIFVLVNNINLIHEPRACLIPIPSAKFSWVHRLYWEWFGFKRISSELNPTLWISMHDVSSRVLAKRQVVYCHNPSPFYKISLQEALLEPKFLIFNFLYKYLYQINIHKNYAVVVQQDWLKSEFYRLYRHSNIVVAHPSQKKLSKQILIKPLSSKIIFFYPALPRVFKNFEVLCRAAKMLRKDIQDSIEIRLTINGTENRYTHNLVRNFSGVKSLHFIGRQNQKNMLKNYAQTNVMLFPSKLETWGLPISEAKAFNIHILLADLAYAHETAGNYPLVSFLDPNDPLEWAQAIEMVCEGRWIHSKNIKVAKKKPDFKNWEDLWIALIKDL